MCATSNIQEEMQFWVARLDEYRWTLKVSSKNAEFLEHSLGVFDHTANSLRAQVLRESNGNLANKTAVGEEITCQVEGQSTPGPGAEVFEQSQAIVAGATEAPMKQTSNVHTPFMFHGHDYSQGLHPEYWGLNDLTYDSNENELAYFQNQDHDETIA